MSATAARFLHVVDNVDPWTSLTNLRIASLDVETTGTDPALGDRIVEVGLVLGRLSLGDEEDHAVEPVIYKRLNWLVNPGVPIPASASRVHGITDADVVRCPSFADVALEVAGWLADDHAPTIPCAYNASFDRAFLVSEFVRSGLAADFVPSCVSIGFQDDRIRWIDPLVWARYLYELDETTGKKVSNTLSAMAARLGVPVGREHRAAEDAEVALRLLWAFAQDGRMPLEYAAMVTEQRRLEMEQQSKRRR